MAFECKLKQVKFSIYIQKKKIKIELNKHNKKKNINIKSKKNYIKFYIYTTNDTIQK